MHVEKARLPKTLSYPVRTSEIEAVLASASIGLETQLTFHVSKTFLDAHFWPPNPRVSHERLYIRVGTVPAEEARTARLFMAEQALPNLVAWIRDLLVLPAKSPRRMAEQYFRQDWDGGA